MKNTSLFRPSIVAITLTTCGSPCHPIVWSTSPWKQKEMLECMCIPSGIAELVIADYKINIYNEWSKSCTLAGQLFCSLWMYIQLINLSGGQGFRGPCPPPPRFETAQLWEGEGGSGPPSTLLPLMKCLGVAS